MKRTYLPSVVIEPLRGSQGNQIGFQVYNYQTKERIKFRNSDYGGVAFWFQAKEAAQKYVESLQLGVDSEATGD